MKFYFSFILVILGYFISYSLFSEENFDKSNILSDYQGIINSCNENFHKKEGFIVIENSICYKGQISKDSIVGLLTLNWDKISYFVVDSGGREVMAVLDVADIILRNKITIIINGSCLSSCANYWFTAAYWKIIPDNTFVAWHGGPGGRLGSTETDENILSYLDRTKERSDAFFKRIGVDIRLISERPEWVGENASGELGRKPIKSLPNLSLV